MKHIRLFSAITVTICVLFSGCSTKNPSSGIFGETVFQSSKSDASTDNKPLTLHLVVNDTYCEKTACSCIADLAARNYEEVISMLKTRYNIDLQLVYCIEEYDMVDSVKTRKYDGAICKPWLVYQLVPDYGMKFTRVADINDPFENSLLSGIFIVKKDSPVQKPSDINGRNLVMGQEDSYEKYYMPMKLMEMKGIKPKNIFHKSSCTEGINMLLDSEAEVAVISDYALFASCAVDLVEKDAFRTIWKTEDIPLCSVILDLNRVSKSDAVRLQDALLSISGDGLVEDFKSKGFVKPVSWIPQPF
jgi:ABC-type phosphate/phosphonate transport system substrate-binding protein